MTLEEFTSAYNQYFRLACKIANRRLHDYHLAGDVAQEVFTEMFQKKEFLEKDRVRYWIMLNSERRALDVVKKSYRRHEYGISSEEESLPSCKDEENPEAMVLKKEMVYNKIAVLERLRNYNTQWYEILVKHNMEDMDYNALAQYYGITIGALRMQVHRARAWLEKNLNESYGEKLLKDERTLQSDQQS